MVFWRNIVRNIFVWVAMDTLTAFLHTNYIYVLPTDRLTLIRKKVDMLSGTPFTL